MSGKAVRWDALQEAAMDQLIGYMRVSTEDQSLNMQQDALTAAGCHKVFSDTASGSKDDRPGLKRALAACEPGDTLVTWRLDRLARSTRHLLQVVEDLEKRQVAYRSLTETIDTSSPTGRLLLTVLAAIATFEAAITRERVKAGMKARAARGLHVGRKPVLTPERMQLALRLLEEDGLSYRNAARQLGVSVSTLHEAVAAARLTGQAAPARRRRTSSKAPGPERQGVTTS